MRNTALERSTPLNNVKSALYTGQVLVRVGGFLPSSISAVNDITESEAVLTTVRNFMTVIKALEHIPRNSWVPDPKPCGYLNEI